MTSRAAAHDIDAEKPQPTLPVATANAEERTRQLWALNTHMVLVLVRIRGSMLQLYNRGKRGTLTVTQ